MLRSFSSFSRLLFTRQAASASIFRFLRNRLIADAYAKAIEDHGITPVGDPEPTEPTDTLKVEPGKSLSFSFEVEVVPEFELPSIEGIKIKKPKLEITDDHVENRLHRQQLRLGTAARVKGDFREGDRLIGHATIDITCSGTPFFPR